uniref:Uncharacterized protein n=1 Tax=Arundo donax TaxID=35708 RepID=A0A0A9CGJ1_ARUDO
MPKLEKMLSAKICQNFPEVPFLGGSN